MHLVFCVEGPSEKEMLRGFLPRLLPADIVVCYMVFEGKQDLEKRLAKKIRGWLLPDTFFIVLRDQDAGNCIAIKHGLVKIVAGAGRPDSLVRIACREMESWFLGDLNAVGQGLNIDGLAKHQEKKKFRVPDAQSNPAKLLVDVTNGLYQKKSGSRAIGPYLDPGANRSKSFQVFVSGIREILAKAEPSPPSR